MDVQLTGRAEEVAVSTLVADAVAPIFAAAALNTLGKRGNAAGKEPSASWDAKPYSIGGIKSLSAPVFFSNKPLSDMSRVAVFEPPPMGRVRRALDLVIAVMALAAFAPALALIAILIKIQDGGPILFSQERIGRGGRRFQCLKFRSMWIDAELRLQSLLEANAELRAEWTLNHKLRKDPRVTKLGDFLRRTSLDELPQLFNILSGHMSVIGPRPIVEAEIFYYGRWYRYYTAVTPGLTGLWQVTGRSGVSYRRRVATDRLYVRMNSLKSYIYILLKTIPAVLARRGAC